MSKVLRRMDTPESRKYWRSLERIAKEVKRLPRWMRSAVSTRYEVSR